MDSKSQSSSVRKSQRLLGKVPETVILDPPAESAGRSTEGELVDDLPVDLNLNAFGDNHGDDGNKKPDDDDAKSRSHVSRSSVLTTRRQKEASKLRAMEDLAKLELEEKRIELKKSLVTQRLRFEEAVIAEQNDDPDVDENDDKNDVPDLAPPLGRQESVNDWLNGRSAVPIIPVPEPSNNSVLEKLLARQSVPKDLPKFSGEPGEWQLFIRQFENTTKMCGLSDEENAMRLAKCLTGKAFDAVCAMLGLPENVPLIIKTLRMTFGRPEMIIKSLISKAKSVPSVSDCNPECIVALSNAVRGLVSTMKSLDCDGHMKNPQLMEELVQKLPKMYQLNWCMQISMMKNYDLSTFSDWLGQLASAACLMPSNDDDEPEQKTAKTDGKKEFKKGQFSKPGLPTKPESRIPGACLKCQQPGHKVSKCPEFEKSDMEKR